MLRFWNLLWNKLNGLLEASSADKLLFAAFIVATLRQMGVNGHFINYDPAGAWNWFQPLEVWSGLAMAALEGVALAYIARRWRQLQPKTWKDWSLWTILLLGILVMLGAVVFYTSFYAFAAQRGSVVAEVFNPNVNMLWNLSVALVNPLIAILIGIVAGNNQDEQETSDEQEAVLVMWEMLGSGLEVEVIAPSLLAARANVSERTAARVLDMAYSKKLLTDRVK